MPELLDEPGTAAGEHWLGVPSDSKEFYLRSARGVTKTSTECRYVPFLHPVDEVVSRRQFFDRQQAPSGWKRYLSEMVGHAQTNPLSQKRMFVPRTRVLKARKSKARSERGTSRKHSTLGLKDVGLAADQISEFFASGGRKAVLKVLARIQAKGLDDSVVDAIVQAFNETVRLKSGAATSDRELSGVAADSFVDRAWRLAKSGNIDSALDLIYDSVDEMLRKNEFSRLDSLLVILPVSELSVDLLLGILTATLPARSRLKKRPAFFADVELVLKRRGEFEEGLLAGLD